MNSWLKMAVRRDVVLRSFKIAAVVGSLLALINHYDRIYAWSWDISVVAKVCLTYLVPYCVSTVAAVGALRSEQESRR